MTVEPVTSAGVTPARTAQPAGISAQLAEARAQLRSATPDGSWDAVLAEVRKLQTERSMPLLTALHTVYARLAAGWIPPRG